MQCVCGAHVIMIRCPWWPVSGLGVLPGGVGRAKGYPSGRTRVIFYLIIVAGRVQESWLGSS